MGRQARAKRTRSWATHLDQTGDALAQTQAAAPVRSSKCRCYILEGLVPRSIELLFKLAADDLTHEHTVTVSCYQIHCEQAYDMLSPTPALARTAAFRPGQHGPSQLTSLRMRLNHEGHFFLENLTEKVVHSAAEALETYWHAMATRFVGGHDMNRESSRAHTVFQLCLTSAPVAAYDQPRRAKLTLVDLAGCEQQKHTGLHHMHAHGEPPQKGLGATATLAESTAINSSLMTLRQVIAARSGERPGRGGGTHVPYRESKLTALLKDSLSGRGRMVMLACLGPAAPHAEGNVHTLEYACMAKRIRNVAVINEHPSVPTLRALRAEVAFLKQQLAAATQAAAARTLAAESEADGGAPVTPASACSLGAGAQGSLADMQMLGTGQQGCAAEMSSRAEVCGGQGRSSSGGGLCEDQEGAWDTQEPRRCMGIAGHPDVERSTNDPPAREGAAGTEGREPHRRGTAEKGGLKGATVSTSEGEGGAAEVRVAPSGGGAGTGCQEEQGRAVTRELVGKIVRYAGVVRTLQQSHGDTQRAHAELRRRFVAAEAVAQAAQEGAARLEQENVELRELGGLLSTVAKGNQEQPLRPSALCSVGRAALLELLELRQENELLHARLDEVVGGHACSAAARLRGPPAAAAAGVAAAGPRCRSPRRPHTVAGPLQRPWVSSAVRGVPHSGVARGGVSERAAAVRTPVAGQLEGRHRVATAGGRGGRAAWVKDMDGSGTRARTAALTPGCVGAHLDSGPQLLSTTGRLLRDA
eukprot:jgi/Ulvmu1/11253/UM073_0025.1